MNSEKLENLKIQRQLRIEAGPARWQELDLAQREAYMRLSVMLVEAVDVLPSLDKKTGFSDSLRKTRTAFLAGGRGTGKTTVLTTLHWDTVSKTEDGLVKNEDEPEGWSERVKALDNLRHRIVWLETLDMEPLPSSSNLLAAILMRLEDAAQKCGANPHSRDDKTRGWMEPSSEYHKALLGLQRLQTDVSLAWNGNLDDRQGQLDPDTYAVEVMRTERARLSVNKKFEDCIHKLAQYVFRGSEIYDPLFVLPVDDIDLNPKICLDLLRLLRLVSVPRLFTIVLGDLKVARTVLALKLSNDLGTIASYGNVHESMLAVDPQSVGALASDVAANALRKLLPPGQRVELRPMNLNEAMNFRPLGASSAAPRLHEMFGVCPIKPGRLLPLVPGTEPTEYEKSEKAEGQFSLRQLLLSQGLELSDREDSEDKSDKKQKQPARDLNAKVTKNIVYEGTRFVEAPPRRVADTWFELNNITNGGSGGKFDQITEGLLTFFASSCRDALRETPTFRPYESAQIERAIDRTLSGSWTLHALPFVVRAETARTTPIEIKYSLQAPKPLPRKKTTSKKEEHDSLNFKVRFTTFQAVRWNMEVRFDQGTRRTRLGGLSSWGGGDPLDDPWESRRTGRSLPEIAVAALIIYHDLLVFTGQDDSYFTTLLTRANLYIDWAITEWRPLLVRFEWPEPPLETFFHFDLFRSAWRKAIDPKNVKTTALQEKQIERLAFAWMSAGTAVLANESAITVPDPGESMPWPDLNRQLIKVTQIAYNTTLPGSDNCAEWLLRIAELLMPEMGLPESISKEFYKYGKIKEFWLKNWPDIMQRRAERLVELAMVEPNLAEKLRTSGHSIAIQTAPEKETIIRLSKHYQRDSGSSWNRVVEGE